MQHQRRLEDATAAVKLDVGDVGGAATANASKHSNGDTEASASTSEDIAATLASVCDCHTATSSTRGACCENEAVVKTKL